jgi:hypothetical protein
MGRFRNYEWGGIMIMCEYIGFTIDDRLTIIYILSCMSCI